MRTKQIFVLLIVIFLPFSGCFDFYQDSNVSLHENIIKYSEEETEYESDEPNIQLEVDSNGMEQYAYVNGTVLSGAGEEDDVVVEIAFDEEYFNGSAIEKYNSMQNDTLDRVQEISDGDTFALTLSIESLMGNTSYSQIIYIKIEELYQNGTVEHLTILENYSVVIPFIDSDGDGVTDEDDAYPYDGNETADSDGDGVGDNSDAFPNNNAPVVSNVNISPEEALQNDELTCNYDVYDADGDTLVVNITWLVNGDVAGVEGWVPGPNFSGKFNFEDEVECSVTVSDGQQTSNAVNDSITILPESSFESNDDDSESGPLPSIGFIGTLAAIAVSFVAVIRRD
ncbi:hypothetical protein OAU99_01745 [Candidatus Poseidoniaceae archaeon]|jgi:hypothetical protein|nr:hypothetical protein [Candidatus Poseidoniaceae archaeon]